MNRVDFTNPGGIPIYQDSLAFMQDAYRDAVASILAGLLPAGKVFDLSIGFDVIPDTPVVGQDTWQWSGGAVAFNGDIYLVDAGSVPVAPGTPPAFFFQVVEPPPLNPATYVQGQTHSPYKAFVGFPFPSGAGLGALPPLEGTPVDFLNQAAKDFIDATTPVPDPWHTVGDPGEPAFNQGWGQPAEYGTPLQFRKTDDGGVELRGMAEAVAINNASVVFTLPVGYRPKPVAQISASNDGVRYKGLARDVQGSPTYDTAGGEASGFDRYIRDDGDVLGPIDFTAKFPLGGKIQFDGVRILPSQVA